MPAGPASNIRLTNSATPGTAGVRTSPLPGTRRFIQLVYATVQRLHAEEHLSIFNIAQVIGVAPDPGQPEQELAADSVLDTL